MFWEDPKTKTQTPESEAGGRKTEELSLVYKISIPTSLNALSIYPSHVLAKKSFVPLS